MKIVSFKEDWHGEWRIYLFGRYTEICWMDPRVWTKGWWISFHKTVTMHGQTMFCLRCLGFDYHWSKFDK